MLQLLLVCMFITQFGYHWSCYVFAAILAVADYVLRSAITQNAVRHVLKTLPGIRGLVEK